MVSVHHPGIASGYVTVIGSSAFWGNFVAREAAAERCTQTVINICTHQIGVVPISIVSDEKSISVNGWMAHSRPDRSGGITTTKLLTKTAN